MGSDGSQHIEAVKREVIQEKIKSFADRIVGWHPVNPVVRRRYRQ